MALEGILVLSVSAYDEPGSRGVRGLSCAHRVDGLACNEMQINIFIDPREYGCRGEEEEEADVWRAEEEDGLKKGIPRRYTRPSGGHVGRDTYTYVQGLYSWSPWFLSQARRREPQSPSASAHRSRLGTIRAGGKTSPHMLGGSRMRKMNIQHQHVLVRLPK